MLRRPKDVIVDGRNGGRHPGARVQQHDERSHEVAELLEVVLFGDVEGDADVRHAAYLPARAGRAVSGGSARPARSRRSGCRR